MAELFDFGFTLVDETELDAVQTATAKAESASSSTTETQEKLDKLFNAIQPLLNNLKMNPEKEYILWRSVPNRTEKIEQFEDHIQAIYSGSK